jgi:hypothetical protein
MDLTNPDRALRFAFNVRPVCKISKYFADLRQSHAPRIKSASLTPWDRIAQAGMIQAFVRRLPEAVAAHVIARYGPRAERPAAYAVLVRHVMKRGHELSNDKLVRELIARWYGKPPDRRAAKKAGVHRSTVHAQGLKVRRILEDLQIEAEDAVAKHLGMEGDGRPG